MVFIAPAAPRPVHATGWTVQKLLSRAAGGQLLLPETRPERAWAPSRAPALLDSLYRGYPSGSMIVQETRGPGAQGGAHLLLDGRQRLASLSLAISGDAARQVGIRVRFDAGGRRGAFGLAGPAARGPSWIDVARLFEVGPVAALAETADPKDPGYQQRLHRLYALYNMPAAYSYPVFVLGADVPYEATAEALARAH